MLISHRYKCIFVKTRKTAGTSIEASLSRYCGDFDVMTPISLPDEPLRGQFGVCPQYYLPKAAAGTVGSGLPAWRKAMVRLMSKAELTRRDWVPYRLQRRLRNWMPSREIQGLGYYNHMPASEILELVGPDVWHGYFKFCFERHPFDKAISYYHYRAEAEPFNVYLEQDDIGSDFYRYAINGELAVDYIGRFEHLEADLRHVCRKVGMPFDGWLPRAKGAVSRNKTVTVSQLTDHQKARIRQAFAREQQVLDYVLD